MESDTRSCGTCRVLEVLNKRGDRRTWPVICRVTSRRFRGCHQERGCRIRDRLRRTPNKQTGQVEQASSVYAVRTIPYLVRLDFGLGCPLERVFGCGATCALITFTGGTFFDAVESFGADTRFVPAFGPTGFLVGMAKSQLPSLCSQ